MLRLASIMSQSPPATKSPQRTPPNNAKITAVLDPPLGVNANATAAKSNGNAMAIPRKRIGISDSGVPQRQNQ
jgi:hypothetical protein